MCWFQEPYIGNKWWHMGASISSNWGFFFLFKHTFFLPFLWQLDKFSLVCEGGGRKKKVVCTEVCSAHVPLSQPFISYPNWGKERDLTVGKKNNNRQSQSLQNVSEEKRERWVEQRRWRDGFDYAQIWLLPACRETLLNNNKWRPSVSPSVIGYNKKSADGKHTY